LALSPDSGCFLNSSKQDFFSKYCFTDMWYAYLKVIIISFPDKTVLVERVI
jgi:hypothetical protein